jgi:hypothetical protein
MSKNPSKCPKTFAGEKEVIDDYNGNQSAFFKKAGENERVQQVEPTKLEHIFVSK